MEQFIVMKTSVENAVDACESQEDSRKKFVDRIIKTNREVFIMSALLDNQMCGYDLIKEIFTRCDVFLSQGAVYPVLYTLEEDGLLRAEYRKGDMRTKRYSLTPKGREIAEKDVEIFAKALKQVTLLLKR
jgi:PadR family transcriptional regulator PadR